MYTRNDGVDNDVPFEEQFVPFVLDSSSRPRRRLLFRPFDNEWSNLFSYLAENETTDIKKRNLTEAENHCHTISPPNNRSSSVLHCVVSVDTKRVTAYSTGFVYEPAQSSIEIRGRRITFSTTSRLLKRKLLQRKLDTTKMKLQTLSDVII